MIATGDNRGHLVVCMGGLAEDDVRAIELLQKLLTSTRLTKMCP